MFVHGNDARKLSRSLKSEPHRAKPTAERVLEMDAGARSGRDGSLRQIVLIYALLWASPILMMAARGGCIAMVCGA